MKRLEAFMFLIFLICISAGLIGFTIKQPADIVQTYIVLHRVHLLFVSAVVLVASAWIGWVIGRKE